MLNAKLQQQISTYLGHHQEKSPQLTALFNCISESYNEMEASQVAAENNLAETVPEINEFRKEFIRLSEQIERAMAQLIPISVMLEGGKETARTVNKKDQNLSSVISAISQKVKWHLENADISAARLRELEYSNKELDQFSYIVSHDLKSPLRAIANLSQWIEDDLTEVINDQARENFRLLRNRVFRMQSLINAILSYSKITKTKSSSQLTDTATMIGEIIDSLACPTNIVITVNGTFPIIHTASVKLQQVFSNLISNAIKYNDKENGRIEIGVFETEEHCQFYVQDNGPGIEPQFQNKVFMLFHTLETTDEYENTGIGLAIVKKLIDESGGRIWIESQKGKGAKFVFLWPKEQQVQLNKINHA